MADWRALLALILMAATISCSADGQARVDPPWVSIEPRWEYKELLRDPKTDGLPTEAELNELGKEHWKLAGVVREEDQVHFYFKRERAG